MRLVEYDKSDSKTVSIQTTQLWPPAKKLFVTVIRQVLKYAFNKKYASSFLLHLTWILFFWNIKWKFFFFFWILRRRKDHMYAWKSHFLIILTNNQSSFFLHVWTKKNLNKLTATRSSDIISWDGVSIKMKF